MAPQIFFKLGLTLHLLTATALLAEPAPGKREAVPEAEKLSLRLVDRAAFCSQLAGVFVEYAQKRGYDAAQTMLLAKGATAAVVKELRAGRAAEFIQTAALDAYAAAPVDKERATYLPLAGALSRALGIQGDVTLAFAAADLRFVPFAQRELEVVVVAKSSGVFTPKRARQVAAVALKQALRVHVIWVGGADEKALSEAEAFAWLAATTGGALVHLGGPANPCDAR